MRTPVPSIPILARPALPRIAVGTCQAEIGNLELAHVVDQQIGRLHVAMEDSVLVQVECPFEKLFHVELDLAVFEPNRRVLEHAVEIVVHVGLHHVDVSQFTPFAGWAVSHIDHGHDTGMLELLEQLDFAQGCNRKTIFGIVNGDLLERDLSASKDVASLENFTKGSLAELDGNLIVVERGATMKLALIQRYARWLSFATFSARQGRRIGRFARQAGKADGWAVDIVKRIAGGSEVGLGWNGSCGCAGGWCDACRECR